MAVAGTEDVIICKMIVLMIILEMFCTNRNVVMTIFGFFTTKTWGKFWSYMQVIKPYGR